MRSLYLFGLVLVAPLTVLQPGAKNDSVLVVSAFIPLIDGGKDIPKLYDGYFNEQIAKQAATAVGKAVSAGIVKMEVQFPPVPNLDEVKFGTPLNQKFGTNVVARDLAVPGGYRPGSDVSRQLVAFSNVYWAKKIANSMNGGGNVRVLSAEPVNYSQIQSKGAGVIKSMGPLTSTGGGNRDGSATATTGPLIVINPGGEEVWNRIYSSRCSSKNDVLCILNNAYSTTYDLGNKAGYEEVYYLKRISKGWVFRTFPGPWQAYLEKPDGTVELLKSYAKKPSLKEIATLVREESFRRFAINNDRWTPGFGERL